MARVVKISTPEEAKKFVENFTPDPKSLPDNGQEKFFQRRKERIRRELPTSWEELIEYTGAVFQEGRWLLFALVPPQAEGRRLGRTDSIDEVQIWYRRASAAIPGIKLWACDVNTGQLSFE